MASFPFCKIKEQENLNNMLSFLCELEPTIFIKVIPILSNICSSRIQIEIYKDSIDLLLNKLYNNIKHLNTHSDDIVSFIYNLIGNYYNSILYNILDKILYNTKTLEETKSKIYHCIYKNLGESYNELLENHVTLLTNLSNYIVTNLMSKTLSLPCFQIIKFFIGTKDTELILHFLEVTGISITDLIIKTYYNPLITEALSIYIKMLKLNIVPGNYNFLNDLYLRANDAKLAYMIIQCYNTLVPFCLELDKEVLDKMVSNLNEITNVNWVYHIIRLVRLYTDFNKEDRDKFSKIISIYNELDLSDVLSKVLYTYNNTVISGEIYSIFALITAIV
jgi:hypothetical protein